MDKGKSQTINELNESIKLFRSKGEELVNNLKLCLESRDFDTFNEFFDPKSVLNLCNEEIIGRNLIKNCIQDHYLNEELKLYKVRLLIDSNQRHISCEWITRRKPIGGDKNNSGGSGGDNYLQSYASWYLKLSPNDCTIKTWYIWIDKSFNQTINSLETPLPKEIWMPGPIEFYSRKEISEMIRKRLEVFEHEEVDAWSDYLADDIIIRPPWDHVAGKDSCIKGAKQFFSKYENTSLSKIELLYDETLPNWCVYIQIFSTVNRETGKKGEDVDFIFNEVKEGKVRYWRSYFNTNFSQEYTENNLEFFIETITKFSQKKDNSIYNKDNIKSNSSTDNTNIPNQFIGSGKD